MTDALDPLLAPVERTEEPAPADHDMPGSDRPEWLLPSLVVAFGSLIAGLVIFGQGADDGLDDSLGEAMPAVSAPGSTDGSGEGPEDADGARPTDAVSSVEPGPVDPAEAPSDGTADTAAPPVADGGSPVVDPVGDAEGATSTVPPGAVDLELPAAGVLLIDDTELEVLGGCAGLLPQAPEDTTTLVSSYVVRPDAGPEAIVERWFGAEGIDGVHLFGEGFAGWRQVEVVDATVPGAFAATFEVPDGGLVDLVLNPPADDDLDCSQTVVTNVPGQLAFPFTRAVLTTCVDGDPATGGRLVSQLSEGAVMATAANGDGSHVLTLRTPETALSPGLELADPAGSLSVDGARLGYSGLVTDGDVSFDLTFDVDVSDARPCTDADR